MAQAPEIRERSASSDMSRRYQIAPLSESGSVISLGGREYGEVCSDFEVLIAESGSVRENGVETTVRAVPDDEGSGETHYGVDITLRVLPVVEDEQTGGKSWYVVLSSPNDSDAGGDAGGPPSPAGRSNVPDRICDLEDLVVCTPFPEVLIWDPYTSSHKAEPDTDYILWPRKERMHALLDAARMKEVTGGAWDLAFEADQMTEGDLVLAMCVMSSTSKESLYAGEEASLTFVHSYLPSARGRPLNPMPRFFLEHFGADPWVPVSEFCHNPDGTWTYIGEDGSQGDWDEASLEYASVNGEIEDEGVAGL